MQRAAFLGIVLVVLAPGPWGASAGHPEAEWAARSIATVPRNDDELKQIEADEKLIEEGLPSIAAEQRYLGTAATAKNSAAKKRTSLMQKPQKQRQHGVAHAKPAASARKPRTSRHSRAAAASTASLVQQQQPTKPQNQWRRGTGVTKPVKRASLAQRQRAVPQELSRRRRRTAAAEPVRAKPRRKFAASSAAKEGPPRRAERGVIPIHSSPDAGSPKVSELQKGDLFLVRGQHLSPDGQSWLELADGRGFVSQQQASRVDHRGRGKAHNAGLIATGRIRTAAGQRRDLGGEEEIPRYGDKEDLQLQHFEGTKMSVDGLPQMSRHINHKTVTEDWHEEYPTAAPTSPPHHHKSSANAVTVLPALLIAVVLGWSN